MARKMGGGWANGRRKRRSRYPFLLSMAFFLPHQLLIFAANLSNKVGSGCKSLTTTVVLEITTGLVSSARTSMDADIGSVPLMKANCLSISRFILPISSAICQGMMAGERGDQQGRKGERDG